MCGIWAIFGGDENNTVWVELKACRQIAHRGPDQFRMESVNHFQNCVMGFHRLAIMDDLHGMQPLRLNSMDNLTLCYNGEIYNAPAVGTKYGFEYETKSDGEAIMHLYNKGGIDFMVRSLDGVFALCILDTERRRIYLARDLYGVRPLFRVLTDDGVLAFSSEAKGLTEIKMKGDSKVEPFPPGHYEEYEMDSHGKVSLLKRVQYRCIGDIPDFVTVTATPTEGDMFASIRDYLKAAVKKRMLSHRRIGCMLSGGLDSSLIAALVVECAKEERLSYPIQTFSIGMEGSPDIEAARKVATHIGSEHHEISFTPLEGFEILEKLIYHLETYDITTIRASVGMYLISKYISEKTDSVVIFSGEGADEVAEGYIYFHKAPTAKAGDEESRRLLNDLYMFDVLRADRTTAAYGLELRVPFLDQPFTSYYLGLPEDARQPRDGVEKYLLRKAFDGFGLIPDEILWRRKEAFSDGVSSQKSSWYELLQEHAEKLISDETLADAGKKFPFNPPATKEAYMYRQIFERSYPGKGDWISYFWMPRWIEGASDPSARTLKHYQS